MKNYLNFENDIKDLESELEKLKDPYNQEGLSEVNTDKISKIQSEIDEKLKEVYSKFLPLLQEPHFHCLPFQQNLFSLCKF